MGDTSMIKHCTNSQLEFTRVPRISGHFATCTSNKEHCTL
jgi:hypothetical protein